MDAVKVKELKAENEPVSEEIMACHKKNQASGASMASSTQQKDIELNEVLREYILKNRSDYENFMEPEVIKRYVD